MEESEKGGALGPGNVAERGRGCEATELLTSLILASAWPPEGLRETDTGT